MTERWLITGATGMLGPAVCAAAQRPGIELIRCSLKGGDSTLSHDLSVPGTATALLNRLRPDRVIHLAAVSHPAMVAHDERLALDLNVLATEEIARWTHGHDRWLLFASTDQVFDGERGPYAENARAEPRTTYGATKLQAEQAVIAAGGLVTRLGWIQNDVGAQPDFIRRSVLSVAGGGLVSAVDDEYRTPVTASDVADKFVRLAALGHRGLLHVAGPRHVTPYQFLRETLKTGGYPLSAVRRISRSELLPKGRPRDVRLDTSSLRHLLGLARADVDRAHA